MSFELAARRNKRARPPSTSDLENGVESDHDDDGGDDGGGDDGQLTLRSDEGDDNDDENIPENDEGIVTRMVKEEKTEVDEGISEDLGWTLEFCQQEAGGSLPAATPRSPNGRHRRCQPKKRALLRVSRPCVLCLVGRGRIHRRSRGQLVPPPRPESSSSFSVTLPSSSELAETICADPCPYAQGFAGQSSEGTVSIHGYELSASKGDEDSVDFDSPPWNSLVTLDVLGVDPSNPVELEIDPAVDSPSYTIGSDHEDEGDKEEQAGESGFELSPNVRVVDSRRLGGARPTVVPDSWKNSVDSILHDYETSYLDATSPIYEPDRQSKVSASHVDPASAVQRTMSPSFRVALTGAKSTGKSTCLRYLVNRVLSLSCAPAATARPKLFVLDADCGQPEFGPPGMVTLTAISGPLLKPPHAHPVHQYEQAFFYGHITSAVDPTRYIDCIHHLLMAFEAIEHTSSSSPPSIPILIINLDGWVKSVGEQILQSLMEILVPNHVIQLTGDTKSQQFSLNYLDPDRTRLHHAFSFNSKQESSRGPVVREAPPNGEAMPLDSLTMSHMSPPPTLSVPAAGLRSVRICSYFLQDPALWDRIVVRQLRGIVDPAAEIGNRLAGAKPYQVSFHAVEWYGCFAAPDHSRSIRSEGSMLDVLNASLVGLCCRAATDGESDRQENHLLPCVGLGLIRSIHREARLFYVLTPVPCDRLRNVVRLVRGSVQIPVECTFRGSQSDSFPYQSFEPSDNGGAGRDSGSEDLSVPTSQVLGDQPMRSRGNIARRSLLPKDSM
jgi:polynucleotide 5'-kinase involved in rRNA processing